MTPAQVALAWLAARPGVANIIVGARTEAQLKDNLAAAALKLTAEELQQIDAVSLLPLIYPYWHQGQFAVERFSPADHAMHDGNPPPKW